MTENMEIVIESSGDVRCVYAEAIPLSELGTVNIARGSHVEPMVSGRPTSVPLTALYSAHSLLAALRCRQKSTG